MAETELTCRFVRPDKLVFEGRIKSLVLATVDGELGVWPGHSPLICALGDGIVRLNRLEEFGGTTRRIIISGGYAEVENDEVVILANHARALDDIDIQTVKETKELAVRNLDQYPEGDNNRAYYQNKIKWCDMLLEHAHDLD